jgi:hypothetical protein
MKFVGEKRAITVDENYSQVKTLGRFWDEMRTQFPSDSLLGLGCNWTNDRFDYYIGKIDEDWQWGVEIIEIPDNDWEEYSCSEQDIEIEKLYRKIYERGALDYEIESIEDGIFTTKVHYKDEETK